MALHDKDKESLKNQAKAAESLLATYNYGRSSVNEESKNEESNSRQVDSQHQARHANTNQPAQPLSMGDFIMKNLIYILGVAIVAAVVILAIIVVAPFISNQEAEQSIEESYVSPYDWTAIDKTNGHYVYLVDGQPRSQLGIDVSENQHWIDWEAVANDGINFAMIRLGYRGATAGELYLDEYFTYNFESARAVGLDVGIYFFSQASSPEEAIEEADFVLSYLGDAALSYPIAFDSEERVLGLAESRTTGLDNTTMSAIAEAFCDRIEAAGYESMIYGNTHDMSRYLRSSLEGDRIWWAEYGVPSPTAKLDISMWQYTNSGSVSGIDGDVDMNINLEGVLDS